MDAGNDWEAVTQALEESRRAFAAAFEHAPIGMAVIDSRGSILKANRALQAILGRSGAEIGQISPRELIHPDDLARAREIVTEAARRDSPTAEFAARYVRLDGTFAPCQINTSVVKRTDDSPSHYIVQVQDLTARKQAEADLIQAQKLDTVGRFAAGITHDFNNLLQAMLIQIQLLETGALGSQGISVAASEIEDQIKRGRALVRQLLLFSRRGSGLVEPVNLNELVADAGRMIRRLVPENIAISQVLGPEPVLVDGDRNQLEQVLLNLVVNATDAMREGGTLAIHTGRTNDEFVFVAVRDSGHGIPAEIRDRIFEPFFTTKSPDRGSGLGLSVVHDIVERHAGYIDLKTEEGLGTTFTMVLPAASQPRAATPAPEEPKVSAEMFATQSTGERVLVVEDEAGARDALQLALGALGYGVTTTATAEEAGRLPATPAFRLLLTDLMLPGILGTELAIGLRDRWPDLQVILMSGYLPDDAIRREIDSGRMRFLQKPFGIGTLAAAVRAALADQV